MNVLSLFYGLTSVLFPLFELASAIGIHRPSRVQADTAEKEYIRACYFTNWSRYRQGRGKYLPEDYTPGLCTHMLFAFGWMNEDFTVRAFDPQDLDSSWATGLYNRIDALRVMDPNLKTLLSIGGWTFGTRLFKAMSKTAEGRRIFVQSALEFVKLHKFDGLDIDWEYPFGAEDIKNHALLMKDIHEAFESDRIANDQTDRLLLSAAVSAGQGTIDNAYDIPELAKYFDFILLMSYDFHGAWEPKTGFNSPLFPRPGEADWLKVWTVDWASNYWFEKGMPKEKIVVGLPTYGRGWTLDDPKVNGVGASARSPAKITKYVGEAGVTAYYEICEMLADGAERFWNDFQKVPYLVYGDQWFSYDDEESFSVKLNWLKDKGYGGAFVWTLDFDDFNGQCSNGGGKTYPLIGLIAEELAGRTVSVTVTTTTTGGPTTPNLITTTTPSVTTTTVPAVNQCLGLPDGFAVKMDSCVQFLLCLSGDSFTLDCPVGLHFSGNRKYCVDPSDALCALPPTTSTISPPTTVTNPGGLLLCTTDGFFPSPNGCTEFLRCANGIKYEFSCPGGLHFDSKSATCTFKNLADCAA